MHDHDLDLIAAHASGWLDAAEADEAAALVSSCPDCAAEFTTQREIAGLLGAMPTVQMSEFERARLHRETLAEVGDTRSQVLHTRWLRLASVAAAFVVVIGGVGVLSQLGGSDAALDVAADEVSSGLDSGEALIPVDEDFADRTAADGAEEESMMTGAAVEEPQAESADAAEDDGADTAGGSGAIAFIDVRGSKEATEGAIEEMRALVLETDDLIPAEAARELGAACDVDDAFGLVLATVDGVDVEIVFSGDRADPSITASVSEDCSSVTVEGVTTGG